MIGNVLFTVVILAVVLGVLVLVHEFGHYVAAKSFGVWVHRFAIGFGKPIPGLSFRQGETEWAIAWLPLGGYVKMASRETEPASSVLEGSAGTEIVPPDRVFEAKPVWQRMIIILAGVTFNAVFALVIFTGLAWKNGSRYDPTTTIGRVLASELPAAASAMASIPPGTRIVSVDKHPVTSWDDITERIAEGSDNQVDIAFAGRSDLVIPLHRDALGERAELATAIEPTQSPVIGQVGVGTPAQAAGLAVGDSLIAIDGAPIRSFADAVERIEPAAGRALHLTVIRHGEQRDLTITPKAEHQIPDDPSSPMVGRIGVASRARYLTKSLGPWGALKAGTHASVSSAGTIFRTLRGIADGHVSSKEVGGPILVGQMAAQEARQGFDNLLAFIGLISVNLAIVNLLPIPILDGGAFLFLLVEGVIRRPLPTAIREAFSMVGLALVVLLMAIAFKNDIWRLFGR
ncbi:MAG TPA: RIP metalloprotease RseP [Gemmatimonadales bacterium]|jgi:regulator of sigma E protease